MNQKLVKRIRRNNRVKYPRTNEPLDVYEKDIKKVSKEDRKFLIGKPTSPKPVKLSKRQERIRIINRFKRSGFPKLNGNFLVPVTFLKRGIIYRGRYGLKVISKSLNTNFEV